ncbi:GNAT family N-acetyltransferase [uncultured Jannaschia sp.]|uniref:GNAT family N-acetyltransferase n=1 Tax=uncultured Jannaschia sp. TaxID=293347 RepID=UPI0026389D5D|nr:GNAT family N-acetyltransferase [uncultured Jannaschia sp.]
MTGPAFHDLNAIAPLETERLELRVPVEADWPAHLAFGLSDRMRFTGGPTDRWGAWRSFTSMLGHWLLRGYGFWQVLEKRTGTRVGKVGVLFHDSWPEPELAWHLYDGATGKGYATEAARAARADAWNRLGLGPLMSPIDPENHASRAVAERLGARLEGTDALLGETAEIWRHPAPEAAA